MDRDANLSKLDEALSELLEINSSFGMTTQDKVKKEKKKRTKTPKELKISDKRNSEVQHSE